MDVVGDDVRSGPGGDGRDVDSDELTVLDDKVGDWRVGDWTGPREGSAMREDQERTKDEEENQNTPSDSAPLGTPIFAIPIIPIEPPKLFIPMPFIP